jgi:undecaprenyl diphosphate synthase
MDGNGRWAKSHHLPKSAGHKKGAAAAKTICRACKKAGVKYLTLYAFSSENWLRPEDEVKDLMNLLRTYLKNDIAELTKENVKVRFIGNRSTLDSDLQKLMIDCEESSKDNDFTLILAISYGSRDEIRLAAVNLAQDALNKKVDLNKVDNNLFSSYLDTHEIPDPDLLIRTSGELRISNFLLWQCAYSELYFTNQLWPDFNEKSLESAIDEYSKRDRRFGGR